MKETICLSVGNQGVQTEKMYSLKKLMSTMSRTSKMAPDNVFKNRRVECATVTKDSNGFIILWKGRMASITHWKPIVKLEE